MTFKMGVVAALALLLVVMFAEAKKDQDLAVPKKCGANEEHKLCASSSCAETTCVKPTLGPACTYDCVAGCFCSNGFFRNSQKRCVPRNQCP
ncbi:ixochymostatin-like [Haemaphysalis longicornis]